MVWRPLLAALVNGTGCQKEAVCGKAVEVAAANTKVVRNWRMGELGLI